MMRPAMRACCPCCSNGAPGIARRELLALPENLGFVGAVNRGAGHATGDIVLLNSDTVVTAGWLQALARCLASEQWHCHGHALEQQRRNHLGAGILPGQPGAGGC